MAHRDGANIATPGDAPCLNAKNRMCLPHVDSRLFDATPIATGDGRQLQIVKPTTMVDTCVGRLLRKSMMRE
jgi:hypothetical protein